jgi:hypothetical protein
LGDVFRDRCIGLPVFGGEPLIVYSFPSSAQEKLNVLFPSPLSQPHEGRRSDLQTLGKNALQKRVAGFPFALRPLE